MVGCVCEHGTFLTSPIKPGKAHLEEAHTLGPALTAIIIRCQHLLVVPAPGPPPILTPALPVGCLDCQMTDPALLGLMPTSTRPTSRRTKWRGDNIHAGMLMPMT